MRSRWQELYKQKLVSPEQAALLFQDGDTVVAPLSNGQPTALVNALAQRIIKDELRDCTHVSWVSIRWF